ncbi:tRNA adenosine(34) deaminase TadA [Leucobacter weissii]|uniref:tRNA-specific adenosine deaminase n=2 Tax=Leucobacter weissii TaxID=1983706 RepID=A0A939MHU0_9MICO|nr:tRNA adenosine(34) deaminase TadA [Leucobacter weissii]
MRLALQEARLAAAEGEIPVGAVLLGPDGDVLGSGRNARRATRDPSAHAEIVALREAAAALGDRILDDCTLVVTLEPCVMCAGAVLAARLPRLVFGAWDEKAGAAGSVYDLLRDGRLPHAVPEVIGGVLADESAALLDGFFRGRRRPRSGPRISGDPAR